MDASLQRLASAAGKRTPQSSTGPNDVEQVGVFVNPGGPYTAIYSRQAAYPASAFPIAYPPGSTDTSAIYESMLAPNGGCLGNFATWINSGSGVQAVFEVYNYCGPSPGVVFEAPIDSTFLSTYTQTYADGIPMYASEIFTFDQTPSASSTWHSIIFNVQTGQYDELAQVTGLNSSTTGFALWRSELQPQPCPTIQPMGADYVELWDNTANVFNLATPTLTGTTTTLSSPTSSYGCFNSDSRGPASYLFSLTSPNYHWLITQSQPSIVIRQFPSSVDPTLFALGPDNNVWFTTNGPAKIGYLLPTTGSIGALYDAPVTQSSGGINALISGPQNSLWYVTATTANKPAGDLFQFSLSGNSTRYPLSSKSPRDVVTDGSNLWVSSLDFTGSYADEFAPGNTSGPIAEFPLVAFVFQNVLSYGPDGALWFVAGDGYQFTGSVYRAATSGTVTPITDTSENGFADISAGLGYLWANDYKRNVIARFSTSGTETDYNIPTSNGGDGVILASGSFIYFTEFQNGRVGRLNAATGEIHDYPLQSGGQVFHPLSFAVDSSGNLWTSDQPLPSRATNPFIGFLEVTFP